MLISSVVLLAIILDAFTLITIRVAMKNKSMEFLRDDMSFHRTCIQHKTSPTKKSNLSIIHQLDLFKTYDRVDWTLLRLVLKLMGLVIPMVNWIMGCAHFISFIVLVMGLLRNFFELSKDFARVCLPPP